MAPSFEPITLDSSGDQDSSDTSEEPARNPLPLHATKTSTSNHDRHSSLPNPAPSPKASAEQVACSSNASRLMLSSLRSRRDPKSSSPLSQLHFSPSHTRQHALKSSVSNLPSSDSRRPPPAVVLPDVIEISDDEDETAKPSLPAAQLMRSSSNGLAILKRPREEERTPSDSIQAQKRRKRRSHSRYTSSSPATRAGAANSESEGRRLPLPDILRFSNKTVVRTVDLTRDEEEEEESTLSERTEPSMVDARSPASTQDAKLSAAKQTERIVGRYVDELQSDNEHWTRTWLKRARFSVQQRRPVLEEPTDVFSKMTPLQLKNRPKKPPPDHAKIITWAEARKASKTSYVVPCTTLQDISVEDVPNYSHHVSISKNFLAHNETTLQHWPYFGDDFDLEDAAGLTEYYFLDVVDRWDKLHCLGLADHLAPYVEDMLNDLGCHWSDVLRFLLDPSPNVGTDADARAAKLVRHTLSQDANEVRIALCNESLTHRQNPWKTVLSRLPDSRPDKIGKAAVLCERFLRMTKLSLWQIARRSDYAAELLKEVPRSLNLGDLTCRVCLRFNCPHHGEIREQCGSDEDDNSEAEPHVFRTNNIDLPNSKAGPRIIETDIIHPPSVDFQCRVSFPPTIDTDEGETSTKARCSLKYWQTGQNASLIFAPDKRGPFYPCHHPGSSCNSAKCSCFEKKIACEKTCGCPQSCSRKFQGCDCSTSSKRKGRKRVCFEEEYCACFMLGRECDPDLCGDCGVCEVLDPVNRHDDQVLNHRCSNANIQRGIFKHTILGDSAVHGLGLYACETVKEHDLVGEYRGEIIESREAERRGAVYEHQQLSYLFSLNKYQEIDGTYFGNKTRFINHAQKSQCNLYPRIVMVNTVHRIALYGQRNIKAGEELFFDYGPLFPGLDGTTSLKTNEGQSKAAPHVRNVGLVRNFHNVEHDQDELGNRRAVKVTKRGTGRSGKELLQDSSAVDVEPNSNGDLSVDKDNGQDENILRSARHYLVENNADFGSLEGRDHSIDDEDFDPNNEGPEESESEEDDLATAGKRSRLARH